MICPYCGKNTWKSYHERGDCAEVEETMPSVSQGAKYMCMNFTDAEGDPDGGVVHGEGFTISWGRDESSEEPGVTSVSTVLEAAKERLEYYQSSKLACEENSQAIEHIRQALDALNKISVVPAAEAASLDVLRNDEPGNTGPMP